jgi:hypothetical protein
VAFKCGLALEVELLCHFMPVCVPSWVGETLRNGFYCIKGYKGIFHKICTKFFYLTPQTLHRNSDISSSLPGPFNSLHFQPPCSQGVAGKVWLSLFGIKVRIIYVLELRLVYAVEF